MQVNPSAAPVEIHLVAASLRDVGAPSALQHSRGPGPNSDRTRIVGPGGDLAATRECQDTDVRAAPEFERCRVVVHGWPNAVGRRTPSKPPRLKSRVAPAVAPAPRSSRCSGRGGDAARLCRHAVDRLDHRQSIENLIAIELNPSCESACKIALPRRLSGQPREDLCEHGATLTPDQDQCCTFPGGRLWHTSHATVSRQRLDAGRG